MDYYHKAKPQFCLGPGTCLAELDASSLTAITQAAVRKTYKKGQIICQEGDPCPGLMIIEAGRISGVKMSPQGREQQIRTAGPGDMINEISLMTGESNILTLKSLEDSIVWVIDRKEYFNLTYQHPMLGKIMTQNLARLIVQLVDLIEDLALRNVEGRLARLLLDHPREGTVQPQSRPTQEELAARIGTTSVVVSRVLNEMQDRGTICLDHRQIRILDRKKLVETAFSSYK